MKITSTSLLGRVTQIHHQAQKVNCIVQMKHRIPGLWNGLKSETRHTFSEHASGCFEMDRYQCSALRQIISENNNKKMRVKGHGIKFDLHRWLE